MTVKELLQFYEAFSRGDEGMSQEYDFGGSVFDEDGPGFIYQCFNSLSPSLWKTSFVEHFSSVRGFQVLTKPYQAQWKPFYLHIETTSKDKVHETTEENLPELEDKEERRYEKNRKAKVVSNRLNKADSKDSVLDLETIETIVGVKHRQRSKSRRRVKKKIKTIEKSNESTTGSTSVEFSDENVTFRNSKELIETVRELLDTERKYLQDISIAVKDYKPFLEKHLGEDSSKKCNAIFGNLSEIYKKQIKFFRDLDSSNTIANLPHAFNKNENLFKLYPFYIKNYHKHAKLILELKDVIKLKQDQIDDPLSLASHLITPVQRLCKYTILLKKIINILTPSKSEHDFCQVLKMISKYLALSNDAITIDQIHFPKFKYNQGPIIQQDQFLISGLLENRQRIHAFLFESSLLLALEVMEEKKYFSCISIIDLKEVGLDRTPNKKRLFQILVHKNLNNKKTVISYEFEAACSDIKKRWVVSLEELLLNQFNEIKKTSRRSRTESTDN